MENGDRTETLLPEEVIQHIQSYMSGKEAARSSLLSKPRHTAWLTRPTVDLDDRDFGPQSLGDRDRMFEVFARKTMQRYHDSSLNIKRFTLRRTNHGYYSCDEEFPIKELVVNAMKLGATDLEIVSSPFLPSYLQHDVLGCESLVNLSLMWCEIIGKCLISCSRLKSLDLKRVTVVSDTFDDIISCCSLLEELSLYDCRRLQLKPFRLPKLKRLLLDFVDVDTMFFANFASSFPCLKDLTVLTVWVNGAHIASKSLETITFQPPYEATFDVPNIRKFTYSGYGLPSILVKGASREWKFDISIVCYHLYNTSWFLSMKTTMKKCRLSRIVSLCINLHDVKQSFKHELGTNQVEAEPLMVDNLRIEAPASIFSALLLRLFVICRPKFITQYWLSERCQGWMCKNECLDILCRELMKELITPNSGVPDQYVFRQFGLKKVNMEVYEEFDTEQWRPLPLKEPLNASKAPVQKRKVRFELIWD